MRRTAFLLGTTQNTVQRKMRFLANQAKQRHEKYLFSLGKSPVLRAQFDEMESSIHTKLKPDSIPLMVIDGSRKTLGFEIAQMPAKGRNAIISIHKYGKRNDERQDKLAELLKKLRPSLCSKAHLVSDKKTTYPNQIKTHLPCVTHSTTKGVRGSTVGQGELKQIQFDPLFSLNHTAAMIRANVNRLFRRTWCTSKTIEGLSNHLWIYLGYHNEVLTA